MNKTSAAGWGVFLSLSLLSCEQDTYDKGDGTYSYTRADFCEAHSNSGKAIDYIVTDDGDKLYLTSLFTSGNITAADSLYRTIVYYNKVEQDKAELVSIGTVPTLDIVPADEFERLTTDPVKLESAWVSKSGKYLNLALWLKTGTMGEGAELQSLGMAGNGVTVNADGTRTAHLRLHHGQGDVPEYYSTKYYLSLPASQINADSVCLYVNTYDGEVIRRISMR